MRKRVDEEHICWLQFISLTSMPSCVTRSMNATWPAPPPQTTSAPGRAAYRSSPTIQPAAAAFACQ
ncbi:MAG: hypothetical protein DWI58_12100 [Chloroflexi bacterium]|nr:MAG: hypothetical protein DWI58_12100 [Chloroflexota bacterium]